MKIANIYARFKTTLDLSHFESHHIISCVISVVSAVK